MSLRRLGFILLLTLGFASAQTTPSPYVTITGTMTGPNGLPLSNAIINLTPTQSFFVAGSGDGGGGGGCDGGGCLTGLTAVSPLAVTTGVTPEMSETRASATVDGYLAHTDFNTFVSGASIPAGITFVRTSAYWSQSANTPLTAGIPISAFTLTPCPTGIDYTSGAGYQVYIADGTSSETVNVTTGASGTGNCTIAFTPFFSHPLASTYTIGSASAGIQETWNTCGGVSSSSNFNSQCNTTIPANGPFLGGPGPSLNTYEIYGTIFVHGNQSVLSGYGVSLRCHGRGPCVQVGDRIKATNYQNNTIQGISFRAPDNNTALPAYNGCAITQTQTTGTIATITTASACGFRPGDIVTIQFTDDRVYWGDALITTASGTSFTFTKHSFVTTALQNTPGVVALAYIGILDNAQNTHFSDIQNDFGGELGSFNNFFDFWDDENALVEHYNNNASNLTQNINWTGSYLYSGGGPWGPVGNTGQQWAPVITLRDSSITANLSNGVTVDNSNGVYIENTVIQASGPWQVKASSVKGNYQAAYLQNVYSEGSPSLNPLSPPKSPFPGTGTAGMIVGPVSAAGNAQISGGSSILSGGFASGGTGATPLSYFIVANDTTANTQTSPMRVLDWLSTGSDTIIVRWPRIANGTDTITYDVIRMTTPVGVGGINPYNGGCTGGAAGICGYVALGVSQASACAGALTCTYSDTGSSTTSSYTIKNGTYIGQLNFWPGALVTVFKTVDTTVEQAPIVGIGLSGNPVQTVHQCSGFGASSPGGYTSCLNSVSLSGNSIKNQTGTILTDGPVTSGGMSLSKGRLNFSIGPYTAMDPHHIITLIDSQPALTKATTAYRPPASVYDVWIGTDIPTGSALNAGQLAFGSPISITNYIAGLGDGVTANWGERLTAALKEIKVAALFDSTVTIAGAADGCVKILSQVITPTGVPCVTTSNPLTTLGDVIYGGAAGAQTRLAGPTTPNGVAQTLMSVPSAGAATAPVWGLPGVAISAQTGTSYTIATTDRVSLVTFSNASPVAVTGPALTSNFPFAGLNIGAGLATFTPVSGLVNGNATQILPSNWFAFHYTDGTNARMPVMPTIQAFPDCPNTGQNRLNFTAATGTFACGLGTIVLRTTADSAYSNTTLAAITGLVASGLPTTAFNASVDCDIIYSQQTAPVSDSFGILISVAPTNVNAEGVVNTNNGVFVEGVLTNLTTTTATNIVTFTPSAAGQNFGAHLHAMVEQPSGTTPSINMTVLTSNAADTITIKRGSKCVVNFQ